MSLRRLVVGVAVTAMLVLLGSLAVGEVLSRPATRVVGAPPPDLRLQPISFPTAAGDVVSGWMSRGVEGRGTVLLLHGVRSDRRSMLGRARVLARLGYALLLIDLPAHGESTGERITFGLREGEGVRAALDFLRRELPDEPIGVIGASLGAASVVLSGASPPPDAVVLESMYPTIEEAVANRLERRLGPAGGTLAPLLLAQLPLRLGVTADRLRPIDVLPALGAPVLIASGTRDEHTTIAETERLFAAAVDPKALWRVAGAAHGDLHAYDPRAYEERVLAFLHRHLGRDRQVGQ
jgi:fermentation-respiration switch protein FrsA (DUF1100 family)